MAMTANSAGGLLGGVDGVAATLFVVLSAVAWAGSRARADMLIDHVNVVPMTVDGPTRHDVTVIVRGERIAAIVPAGSAGADVPGRHVSGAGKWLMPSLTDAHVHLENDRLLRLYLNAPELPSGSVRTDDLFLPYVANGVLQVVDLSAMSETFVQRADVESGRVLGPHIITAAMIDGAPPTWPVGMTRVASTPEAGRQAVRDAAVEGYDLIKVYSRLDLPTFTGIIDEAGKAHLRVVGHIPGREQGVTEQFFQPGFAVVAHAEEFAQQTAEPEEAMIPRYAELAKRNGTWLTATLTLDDRLLEEARDPASLRLRPEILYLNPLLRSVVLDHNPYVTAATPGFMAHLERIVTFNRNLVAAFAAAGVPILAGTDAPVPGVVPGFALHDELEALVQAGLTSRQALESTTRLPAEWLGLSSDRGTVAVGMRADLLLLDADPLADVANTRRIAAVIVNGRYVPRGDLDRRMRALQRRNASGAAQSPTMKSTIH